MSLLRRVFEEKRAIVLPLGVALLVNVGVYAFIVYPLSSRAAGAVDRASAATRALTAAVRDEAAARALVTSKAHAEQELATFYDKVLPDSQSAARRITYAHLPELARKAAVKYEARHTEVDVNRVNPRVGRLKIRMVLQGDYEGFRQFVYDLESAPEFLIIEDVTLSQGDPGKPLTLTINLSAYYRAANAG